MKIKILIFLILAIIFVTFLPSLRNKFINWDDDVYIVDNSTISYFSWNNLRKIFTSFSNCAYQPLVLLSYMSEYHFFKLNPFGYHFTNLILHSFNCMLVFWFIYMVTRNVTVSFITAILFAIHPLRVESVAWISERKGLLYVFFFLGAIVSYCYYSRSRKSKGLYWFSLLLFFLSLLSKGSAVTLPLVLLLVGYFLYRDSHIGVLKDKIPFFFLSFVFGIIGLMAIQPGVRTAGFAFRFLDQIKIASYGIIFYLYKLFIPLQLSALYSRPLQVSLNTDIRFILAPFLILILLVFVVISGRRTRKVIFGTSIFIITILPILQFIPVGQAAFADRYTYFPSIGIFYLFGECFVWFYNKKSKSPVLRRMAGTAILIMVIFIYSLLAQERISVWKDSIVFWDSVLRDKPSALAYTNRGIVYSQKGQFQEAQADFNRALEIDPGYLLAYLNRGNLWYKKGSFERAIADYDKLLAINPNSALTYTYRGIVYQQSGNDEKALDDYNKALQINPPLALAYLSRARLWREKNDSAKAVSDYLKAINIEPNSAGAHFNLGTLYQEQGAIEGAIAEYDLVIKISPDDADAHYNRGLAHKKKGSFRRALLDFDYSIKNDPRRADAYYERGNIYYKNGNYDKAIADYTKAIEINPDFLNVYINRAYAYFYQRDYGKSWDDLRRAESFQQKIDPEFIQELKRLSGRDK